MEREFQLHEMTMHSKPPARDIDGRLLNPSRVSLSHEIPSLRVAKIQIRVQEATSYRLDEIYRYTRDHWGAQQTDRYITGLFEAFDGIESRRTLSRSIPAEFDIDGYLFRDEPHFVYWRRLSNNDIGIVTILHTRMHRIDRFREDFGL